ncbi:MAG TPA: MATE family efflux transporter [Candidatus Mediterraneibacter cottocaccae]|nr:MATE family efflux transporter [Candidatus Mediterraneibacter cottocaccae]
MEQTYMKEQPVLRLMLRMSLPMVLSMMVNSLYNIVDSFFVAQISEDAMTALSLVYPVQNLVNAVTIGFGIGINAVIAFYLGAQEQKKADDAAAHGVVLNVLHGVLLTVICLLVMPAFLRLFTSDEAVIAMGLSYSNIVFAFSVIIALGLAFEKIFQAVGKMAVSMAAMLAGCICNIILDPVLIFGIGPFPEMGIQGAALATGLGQVLTLAVYLAYYFRGALLPVRISLRGFSLQKRLCLRLYAIGIPAILNLALPSLLISALNAILAGYSQAYVLVLGVYYKLQTFLYLPANGIVQGMRPLIGYNYGAGEHRRVRSIYRTTLALAAVIMAAGTILCLVIPGPLMGLFTTNASTVAIGAQALRIICIGFLPSAVSVASSGALEGLGKGVPSLMISLCRYLILIIPAAFGLSLLMGATGVWHAFWITELITAVFSLFIYRFSVYRRT